MAQNALLVMDVQRRNVDGFGDNRGYLARLRSAIDCARAADIPVIYAVIGFRAGHPEANLRNKILRDLGGGIDSPKRTRTPKSTRTSRPGPPISS
jgi:nicotinamidase-related amidase